MQGWQNITWGSLTALGFPFTCSFVKNCELYSVYWLLCSSHPCRQPYLRTGF